MSAGSRRIVRLIDWTRGVDERSGAVTWHAGTPVGRYAYWEAEGRGWWVHHHAPGRIEAGTLAEARDAAQAHHDGLVLSTLEGWVAGAADGEAGSGA